jgi:hypothetical protein
MSDEAAQQGVEADEAEHNGASQLNSSVGRTVAGRKETEVLTMGRFISVLLLIAIPPAVFGATPVEEAAAVERLLSEVNTPVAVRRARLDPMETKQGMAVLSLRLTAIEARSLKAPYRAGGVGLYWSLGEKACTALLDASEVSGLLHALPTLRSEAAAWRSGADVPEGREVFYAPRSSVRVSLVLTRDQGIAQSLRCLGSEPLGFPMSASDLDRLATQLQAGLERLKAWSAEP